ncbi:MAG: hypothetical protein LBC80_01815, partial [Treponema sp.]|nr:hypothetical protein [Treponema sp.]
MGGQFQPFLRGQFVRFFHRLIFTTAELQTLVERVVQYGDGLIMLGGINAFSAGGYAGTPIAYISPIEMRQADRQPLGAPPRTDIH